MLKTTLSMVKNQPFQSFALYLMVRNKKENTEIFMIGNYFHAAITSILY